MNNKIKILLTITLLYGSCNAMGVPVPTPGAGMIGTGGIIAAGTSQFQPRMNPNPLDEKRTDTNGNETTVGEGILEAMFESSRDAIDKGFRNRPSSNSGCNAF